ncbi:hypothetical protein NN561_017981 [Cricetulus griseus]
MRRARVGVWGRDHGSSERGEDAGRMRDEDLERATLTSLGAGAPLLGCPGTSSEARREGATRNRALSLALTRVPARASFLSVTGSHGVPHSGCEAALPNPVAPGNPARIIFPFPRVSLLIFAEPAVIQAAPSSPVLVLASRLGKRAPRTPCTELASTPPAPAGSAGSAHVRGYLLAAPGSPVAEAPLELRAPETPCSAGLLPSASPAPPKEKPSDL